MQRLFALALLAGAGWLAYSRYQHHAVVAIPETSAFSVIPHSVPLETPEPDAKASTFTCDGRQYCSEMHSCAEATYFIQNCPNTKMDGDHDGIPCERQWCEIEAR